MEFEAWYARRAQGGGVINVVKEERKDVSGWSKSEVLHTSH